MQDPKNWKTLAFEFASAIHKMRSKSLTFLRNWWASLEVSSLNSLVQMLKKTIVSQLHNEVPMMKDTSNLKVSLEMMKEVQKILEKTNSHLHNEVPKMEDTSNLKVLLEVMKEVHEANCQLPENAFIMNDIFNFNTEEGIMAKQQMVCSYSITYWLVSS